ncbi:MAG: 2-dehydropantoate 2-reductase [Pseudomonadota bacterium]
MTPAPQKIAIVGCGAMGSVYAAHFAEAGHEVWCIDSWAEHVAALRQGLRLEGFSGDRTITGLNAATDPAEAGVCDLVILSTKAAGVAPAAAAMAPLLGPGTPVLTIQNGLGAAERLAEHMDPGRIVIGVAQAFGASLKGPGQAHHNNMSLVRIGEPGGGLSDRVQAIEALWQGAGFTAQAYDDIGKLVWEKFICNCAFSAPCTVFHRTIGEMMAEPGSRALSLGCGTEAWAVAKALGIAIDVPDPEAYITEFAAKMPEGRPSMLLDHLDLRRSEIDAINGMVPVKGAEAGVPTPMNTTVTTIVRAREAKF